MFGPRCSSSWDDLFERTSNVHFRNDIIAKFDSAQWDAEKSLHDNLVTLLGSFLYKDDLDESFEEL